MNRLFVIGLLGTDFECSGIGIYSVVSNDLFLIH